MKKILSIVLTLAVVFGMFIGIELPVFAATSGTTGDCTWILNGTELTISGNGKMGDYEYDYNGSAPWGIDITEVIIVDGVTSVGDNVFCNCTGLTRVIIPNSVTSIGDSAFSGCYGLTNVTIPNSVTSIGNGAFCATGLVSVVIPGSVTNMGDHAFGENTKLENVVIEKGVTSVSETMFCYAFNLKSIVIPDSVTSIGRHAFDSCGFANITIPDSVTSIGNGAFFYCENLTSVVFGKNVELLGELPFKLCRKLVDISVPIENKYFSSQDGVLFNKDKTVLLKYPEGKVGAYTIPNSVREIYDEAFALCEGLTSIVLPESVESIGTYAFGDCANLKDIWFAGDETDWALILIAPDNDVLFRATWHYNYHELVVGEDIAITDGKIKVPATSGYFTDKNGKLHFPGEYVEAEAGDVLVPAPIEVAADNAFSVRLDSTGIRARGALSKGTVEAASEIGFVIVPRIAPDLAADWYISSQYTYKQPVYKSSVYGAAEEIDGYQYQLCLRDLDGFEAEDFLFAMYVTVNSITTYTYVGCASYDDISSKIADKSETIAFEDLGYKNGADFSSVTVNDVTISAVKNNGSTPPRYYATGKGIRIYGKNTLTIAVPYGYELVSVKFTLHSSNKFKTNTAFSAGTVEGVATTETTVTVIGSNELVVTNPDSPGHYRIQKVEVTYKAV